MRIRVLIGIVVATVSAFFGITAAESITPVADAVPVVEEAPRAEAIAACHAEFVYDSGGYKRGAVSYCNSPIGPGTQHRVLVLCWNGSTSAWYAGGWFSYQFVSGKTCPADKPLAIDRTFQTR